MDAPGEIQKGPHRRQAGGREERRRGTDNDPLEKLREVLTGSVKKRDRLIERAREGNRDRGRKRGRERRRRQRQRHLRTQTQKARRMSYNRKVPTELSLRVSDRL